MKLTIGTSTTTISTTQYDNELELPDDTDECIAIDIANKIIPLSIVNENIAEVVLKDNSVIKGKLMSTDLNSIRIKDDDGTYFQFKSYKSVSSIIRNIAIVNNKGSVTFVYKTNLINWTPRVLVKIEENELRSTLLASITNNYIDLTDLKINLIGEYQPRYHQPRMMAMRSETASLARAVSPTSSIANNDEPTGSFAFQTKLTHLNEGKSLLPILEESKVKYQEYYQAIIRNGKQQANRIISYLSPDDYPAGEYTFILPSGVHLNSSMPEYHEGQRVKQSIGPSSNVVISITSTSVNDRQAKYKIDINAIKECSVMIDLPYYNQSETKLINNSKNISPKAYQEDGSNGWQIDQPAGLSTLTVIF